MADERQVSILLVDDDEDDFVMVRELLAEGEGDTQSRLDWVAAYDEALAAIRRGGHDVYLLDYRLGERTGLDLLRQAVAFGCKAPMILLTGQGDEEVDLEAMKAGAADYLVKGRTDAHLLERSIRYALERSKVEQMKDHLLAFASHELRTPVTAIRGYAQTLLLQEAEEVGELCVECLGHVIQGADHLTRLIDGFLDLSRVDAGRPLELAPDTFEVRGMVEEAVEIARMAARRCRFEVHYGEALSTLYGDRYKLLLVLINLLSNADKYWPEGGVVQLEVLPQLDHLRFAVIDGGIGIAPENLDAIFLPFYRVAEVQGHAIRGTGLGLCLSKHIVQAHGGRIWVESELGRGATVLFTVPA